MPKELQYNESNLFNTYNIYFLEGNRQHTFSFKSASQIKLFRFFHFHLEVRGTKLEIPEDAEVCERIGKELVKDYRLYFEQIKGVLKSLRSTANPVAIYREMIFKE